jgi:hypothetical protein
MCPVAYGQVATNGSGAYVAMVPNNWSGVVRPQSTSLSFTPADRAYLNVTVNQTGQTFTLAGAATTPPVANPQSTLTYANTPVIILLTGSGGGGQSLTFAISGAPVHGTLGPISAGPAGSAIVAYTPAANYTGADSFMFTVSAGGQQSAPANVSIGVSGSAGGWTPPIGIPAPSFGITQVAPPAPSSWNQAVAGFFYVDNTHPLATDTNNPNGWPGRPRLTIPFSPVLPAGSVVKVAGGPYTYNSGGVIPLNGNGTAQNPVFISGANPASPPLFTRKVSTNSSSSYLIVEHIRVDTGGIQGAGSVNAPAHHLAYRHCEFSNCAGGLVIASYVADATVHDIVLSDVTIHDLGDLATPLDQDYHAVGIGARAHHIWVLDSLFYHTSGDGVQINAGSNALWESTHHIYIGRNTSHHNRQAGLFAKQSRHVIMSQNHVHNILTVPWSPGKGLGFQYGPGEVWFLFNRIHDCEYGIYAGSDSGGLGTNQYIIGNLIYDIHHIPGTVYTPTNAWSQAGIMLAGGTNRYILNNVIYDADAGINVPGYYGAYTHLEDNLISHLSEPQGPYVFIEQPGQSQLKNSLLYRVGGPILITWGSGTYTSLSTFQSATGQGQASLVAVPLFENAAAGNFQLQAGSPGVNGGTPSYVYTMFMSLYGLSINVDFNGMPRPLGGAYDMGAFER